MVELKNKKFETQKKKQIKHKVYDSVFIDLFSMPENLLDLYKTLLGNEARKDVKESDIKIINTEKVLTNDLYNDLSFLVDNELIILMEAQSTYSQNIATRILFYAAKSLEKHLRNKLPKENLMALYYEKIVEIPKIKLYTVYTGARRMSDHDIELRMLMKNDTDGVEPDLNLKVKVLCIPDEENTLGQYMLFCSIFREQREIYNNKDEAIKNTIKICKNGDILKEYLMKREYEVYDMMAHLMTTEEWMEANKEEWTAIGEKRGISIGEKRGISIGEKRGKIEVAKTMLAEGVPSEKVVLFTGLSLQELETLQG